MEITKESIALTLLLLEYPYKIRYGDLHLDVLLRSKSLKHRSFRTIWVRSNTFVVFKSIGPHETFPLSEWDKIELLLIESSLPIYKQQSN
jgi:hypothetical protein